ncbi:hypothetical protein [Desulfurispira natronophila]|uniref:Lipopolysaccharide biosynthesis regulator YciM n=1 Tax=Desulfurispira natronophila TaxID=682562 RepID=A0A7W7Y331_9BACT|nr:hypothetical protein [Desulfurispira natronophila]MBB5021157.1 lipopolysaccharide biosynthesis regulator YciM [Desulfurispira natronophila]
MHSNCSAQFDNGAQVVDKLRMMGFEQQHLPLAVAYTCVSCQADFTMETLMSHCPQCGMTYGVTPCHAHDPTNILAAGVNY